MLLTDRSSKIAGNSHCTCGCQHLCVASGVAVEALEGSDDGAELGCHHAGHVDKRTLLAGGHATAQSYCQSNLN